MDTALLFVDPRPGDAGFAAVAYDGALLGAYPAADVGDWDAETVGGLPGCE
ncbi:MAG: hypothetical protein ACLP3C_20655 [Mycobacterium sp.]|uniref:hypothetical protein n=1 Tax=Mycobacterium sp. TaxID=1785 RepID=UPI003C51BE13